MSGRALPRPPAVYAIADAGALAPTRPPEAVETMAEVGIGWIQLRAKGASSARLHAWAEEAARRLEGSPARLWIDDRADVARMVGAAGVHLGQRDLPAAAARRCLPDSTWVGCSTHDAEQLAEAAADEAVDVVALGPIFPTTGKEAPDPAVGLAALGRWRAACGKPLVAIGGIDAGNLAEVLAAGADSVAVIGAVCRGDIAANCRRLLAAAEGRA